MEENYLPEQIFNMDETSLFWKQVSERNFTHKEAKLSLSNPIFHATAYSPALICFGWERGWWITCNYPTVLKEKSMEKQKEHNLHSLLAKVRTT
jgi:hypothetical protein